MYAGANDCPFNLCKKWVRLEPPTFLDAGRVLGRKKMATYENFPYYWQGKFSSGEAISGDRAGPAANIVKRSGH